MILGIGGGAYVGSVKRYIPFLGTHQGCEIVCKLCEQVSLISRATSKVVEADMDFETIKGNASRQIRKRF